MGKVTPSYEGHLDNGYTCGTYRVSQNNLTYRYTPYYISYSYIYIYIYSVYIYTVIYIKLYIQLYILSYIYSYIYSIGIYYMYILYV